MCLIFFLNLGAQNLSNGKIMLTYYCFNNILTVCTAVWVVTSLKVQ